MTTKIYEDRWGRLITEFRHVDGLKLEIYAEPWRLSPDEARKIGLVLFQWAVDHDAPADPDAIDKARPFK